MAWEQVLSPEVMARINAYYAPQGGSGYSASQTSPYQEGGRVYQKDGDFIYSYDPTKQEAGQDRFGVYGADGKFSNEGTFKTDDAMQTFLMALAAAGGMQFLPGGAFNAGAGGAGYGAGGATEPVASMGGNALSGVPGGAGMDVAGFEGLTAGDVGLSSGGGNALLGSSGSMVAPAASDAAFNTAVAGGSNFVAPTVAGGTLLDTAIKAGSVIAPVIGGVVAGNAAQDAAETQAQSAREAQDVQERMFNKIIELNEPFRQGGLNALEQIQIGIGLKDGAGKGDLTRDFTMADFQADPGYQFRLDEGQRALDRFAASRGRFNAGRTLKDTMRFQQGEASQEFGRANDRFNTNQLKKLNPLQSLTGVAQSATNTVGGAAQNYGNNAANLITGAGNATAAGQVGRVNALTNGISQGFSQYQNQQLLDRLLERGRY